MEVSEVKEYLRITSTDEDTLLTGLLSASIQYIENTTGVTYSDSDSVHKLAVKILIAHWYENRQAVTVGTISKELEFSLSSLLCHISLHDGGEVV